MRCVVSAAKPAACSALLLLSAVIVAGFGIRAAHANEPDAAPLRWCVARSDVAPNCVHSDLVSCSIAALVTGGFCFKEEPAATPAMTVAAAPPRQKRSVARRKASASQQDELFREFERWKRTTAQ